MKSIVLIGCFLSSLSVSAKELKQTDLYQRLRQSIQSPVFKKDKCGKKYDDKDPNLCNNGEGFIDKGNCQVFKNELKQKEMLP